MPQILASPDLTAGRGVAQAFPPFELSVRAGGLDAAWVRAVGELDIATAPRLERTLRGAALRSQRLVLDLRELTFIDCCGVHVIVNASLRARRVGRRLIVVRGPSQVDRVFVLTNTATALEFVDLNAGEPPVQALLQIARRDRAA